MKERSTLNRYLDSRRYFEFAFWALLLTFAVGSNTLIAVLDHQRNGLRYPIWEPILWECSSVFMLACLLPLMIAADKRFPLRWRNFPRCAFQHFGLSIAFSLIHVGGMVAIRKVIYVMNDSYYDFGPFHIEFFYEYLKDLETYFSFIALIYLYRFIIIRLQGEASVLDASETEAPDKSNSNSKLPERLLVKKLGKEFLILSRDIEFIEAAGNYVNLHIKDRIYPLRETMARIEEKLDKTVFARVHRSRIVNLNCIAEITPLESGDAEIKLHNGVLVPVSRTYKNNLKYE